MNMFSLRLEALCKAVVPRLWKGIQARESYLLGLKLTKLIENLVYHYTGIWYRKDT